MKKLLLLGLLTVLIVSVYGQTIVSTSPEYKNVILEEYTGVINDYSPDGHKIHQVLSYVNPEDVFVISIHQGEYADPGDDYLDFRTEWGDVLFGQTLATDYPVGTVNRHVFADLAANDGTGIYRGNWTEAADRIMLELSYVNVAVEAEIDAAEEILTVHVEIYYTGGSPETTNYLNVAILQDDIIDLQLGSLYNPNMMTTEGEYKHQNVLRHFLTGQLGEAINSTTTGSFIEKTYTYNLPNKFEDINVEIGDLEIVAFVAESSQEIISGDGCIPVLVGAPIVNMEASIGSIYQYETIQFTDVSAPVGTSRIWTFPGGIPATSTEVSPIVEYREVGSFDVTLSVNNDLGTSEEIYSGFVDVTASESEAYSLEFEGSMPDEDGPDQMVNAPNAASLIAGTDHFSIACWVFPRYEVADWMYFGGILGFRDIGMNFYILQLYGTTLEARFGNADGELFTMESGADLGLVLDEYQHLALTYDGSNMILYKNGEVIAEMEATGVMGHAGNTALSIGTQLPGNYDWTFDGEIDEVTVWTKALTQEEVSEYMCITEDPKYIDGLALYYNFSETGGEIVDDKVGNHQGYMINITEDNRISSGVCEFEYTSIVDNELIEIVAYPNPVRDIINLTNCEGANIEIFNIVGQSMLRKENVSNQINVSKLPKGLYLLRIENNNQITVRKVEIK